MPRVARYPALGALLVLLSSACGAAPPEPAAEAPAPAPSSAGGDQVAPAATETPEPPAPEPPASDAARAIVAAPDRDAKDRETDVRRHPAAMLTFMGVQPGMRVADLGAGGGYTTELLARAVGPEGKVWGQNNALVIERFVKDSWPARLQKPVNAAVVRVDREMDAPLPPDATDLDLVTMIFYYHDALDQGTDMAAMNRAIYAALEPGGAYVIADHHAREGSDLAEWKKLHRVDRAHVVREVQAAGFQLADEADFLRDASDARDTAVWKVKFRTDRFLLKFVKPAK